MGALIALSRGIDWINEKIGKAVSWLIFLAIVVSAGNAVVRKVMNTSSNAWLELQWYLYGAAFLLAASYTLKQNEHIRIDIIYGALKRRTQNWIDLFGHVFFLFPMVSLMIWLLAPYALHSYTSGEMSSNSGGLIVWPAKALMLLGFVLLFLQAISEIIKKVAILMGLIEDPFAEGGSHSAASVIKTGEDA